MIFSQLIPTDNVLNHQSKRELITNSIVCTLRKTVHQIILLKVCAHFIYSIFDAFKAVCIVYIQYRE